MPDQSLQIAFVASKYPPIVGGGEIACQRLATELVRRGHRVRVITRQCDGAPDFETSAEGVEVQRAIRPLAIGPLWGITYMRQVRALLRGTPWSVIHCHQVYLHSIEAVKVAREVKAACVSTLYSTGELNDFALLKRHRFGRMLVRMAAEEPAGFIALSRLGEDELRSLGAPVGLRQDRVARIPNFVDCDAFRPAHGVPPTPTLVFVGRLVSVKNIGGLMDAFAEARRDSLQSDARLLIVGDGAERGALEARAAALGLSDSIEFAGMQRDVRPFLHRAVAAVSASRAEGMSNAVLEQMACGLPVAMFDVGGVRDCLDPDDAGGDPAGDGLIELPGGLVARPDQPWAFAAALTLLLRDPARARRMGVRARALVEQHFATGVVVDQILDLYARLRLRTQRMRQ